jgi:hypothetical protein
MLSVSRIEPATGTRSFVRLSTEHSLIELLSMTSKIDLQKKNHNVGISYDRKSLTVTVRVIE